MKKITLFLAVLLTAMTSMAQIKVAILEPVDKGQNVSYGIKLLLRSSLTSAISNTPGYEGYDRVDMASIAGEQDFQRTGNVSDSQIKQLGVATGAAYVLVAEAAKYDATSIIITAKILDVETFGITSSVVQVSGTTASEMEQSCTALAGKLLKPVKAAPSTSQITTNTTPITNQVTTTTITEDWITTIPNDNDKAPKKKKKKIWPWIVGGIVVGSLVGILVGLSGSGTESYTYTSYGY